MEGIGSVEDEGLPRAGDRVSCFLRGHGRRDRRGGARGGGGGRGGGIGGPELAAAVSNAGGLGVLGMGGLPAPLIREEIGRTRGLTQRPFAVNLILPLLQEGQVEVCFDERVPVVILFWGDPKRYA